ncbi:protein MIZU-KUSSEI 1-like [Nymphaea colorata]|nr:protein MIZU-KUSSEI 1-like [Nymphaea colorata]
MADAKRVAGRRSPLVRLYGEPQWRRLLRRVVHALLPNCTCPAVLPLPTVEPVTSTAASGGALFTGTFYGRRTKRVSFCLQEHPKACPRMILELPVLTSYLAVEMQDGIVRLVLGCNRTDSGCSLWSVPVWTAFCNGRRIGFAESKKAAEDDDMVLKSMEPVSAGAGMLPGKKESEDDPFVYLRANFSRVVGSADSESFHMINPGSQ